MNCFIYEVHYDRSPLVGDRVRVSQIEAAGALSTFGPNLQLHLVYGGPVPAASDASEVTVKVVMPFEPAQRRTTISVHTPIDEARVDVAVDEVARSHGLRWTRIESRVIP
jgi:hypothetical protein